jgi:hypothetical protein
MGPICSMPPSTTTEEPVRYDAPSLARNATAAAISRAARPGAAGVDQDPQLPTEHLGQVVDHLAGLGQPREVEAAHLGPHPMGPHLFGGRPGAGLVLMPGDPDGETGLGQGHGRCFPDPRIRPGNNRATRHGGPRPRAEAAETAECPAVGRVAHA